MARVKTWMKTSNVDRTPSRLVDCWDVEAMSKSGVGVRKVREMEVKRKNPNRNCGCGVMSRSTSCKHRHLVAQSARDKFKGRCRRLMRCLPLLNNIHTSPSMSLRWRTQFTDGSSSTSHYSSPQGTKDHRRAKVVYFTRPASFDLTVCELLVASGSGNSSLAECQW